MSKYKAGDKFAIEIDSIKENLYGIKGFNALVFDDNGLDRLEQLGEALEKARQEGAEEAWKTAKKIVLPFNKREYTKDELREIFGEDSFYEILWHNTFSEVRAKIEKWEKRKDEIHAGDIVEPVDNEYSTEVYVSEIVGDVFYGFRIADGVVVANEGLSCVRKTGRHVEWDRLREVLKE